MKVEITDEAIDEVVVTELKELYERLDEEWHDIESLKPAIKIVLRQYMIESEYMQWVSLHQ